MSYSSRAMGKAIRAAWRDTRRGARPPYTPVSLSSIAAKLTRTVRQRRTVAVPVAPMPDVGGFLERMERLIETAIAEGEWEEE